ncbi:MAG: filamentous hemagglutinin N-terminal domain-containing protein [Rubrivivax sp.]|nr:filamentous hemagglutinin N-terminal domain-containing protein [Rubrivivax sp.]
MSSKWFSSRRAPIAAAAITLLGVAEANAAAVTDGSVGAVQTLSGAMTVPQTLGTLRGGNLFHSFARFGIAAGESATFTTVDPGIRHVITRVTGGEASVLQGPLALQAAGGARPDFWLLNPAGVLVGAGASFDLPAGLHLATAPQLRFADGEVWSTGSAAPSTLSVAAPESFGFLATPAAALRWQDANVQLAPGSTLSLAGGELAIDRAVLVAPAGTLRLQAPGAVRLGAEAVLGATAPQAGDSGHIDVQAASLRLEADAVGAAFMLAQTNLGGTGGGIALQLGGALELGEGAAIQAVNVGSGSGLAVNAASLRSDGGQLLTQGLGSGPGPALSVQLTGALELIGGNITSVASGAGSAGAVQVRANSIRLDGQGFLGFGAITSQSSANGGAPGAISVTSAGALDLVGAAGIGSNNRSGDAAGAVQVQARSASFEGEGTNPSSVYSLTTAGGSAAAVSVSVAEGLTLRPGGQIQSGTLGIGGAGNVTVQADQLVLQGQPGGSIVASAVTGVSSVPLGGAQSGAGGTVEVRSRSITMTGDAVISTSTLDSATGAGDIRITASEMTIDGRLRGGGVRASVLGGTGDAGRVQVDVRDGLTLQDGGVIEASNAGSGAAGSVVVNAGSVRVDGSNAGNTLTGISADGIGAGAGAPVLVQAGRVEVVRGGVISSSAFGVRDGGSVTVRGMAVWVDGGSILAEAYDAGAAGSVTVEATQVDVLGAGSISTSTIGSGRGGSIAITAERVRFERSGGAFSVTAGAGDAGRVTLDIADTLTLAEGGFIVTNTGDSGAAGRIDIRAGRVEIGGVDPASGQRSRITSRALTTSGGQSGSITLDVAGALDLRPGALLSIANDASVADPAALAPTALTLRAGSLSLEGADITAAASGNARAGAISIDTAGPLRALGSRISTTAVDGDGGPITIAAAGGVLLKDSAITTSVAGTTNGNGGDITLTGDWLAMASGFVQANTTAPRARGGNVTVNVGLLVPDGSNVFVGGSRIAEVRLGAPGYNVIQAAAPEGLAGQLDLTRPDLNLSSSLVGLLVPVIDFGLIGRDICAAGTDSTFTVLGGGALPAPASAPLRIRPTPTP